MRTLTAGELHDLGDAFGAALGNHVGGAELLAQVGAIGVPAHQDDPLGAHLAGREHCRQSHRAVADHGDGLPRATLAMKAAW